MHNVMLGLGIAIVADGQHIWIGMLLLVAWLYFAATETEG